MTDLEMTTRQVMRPATVTGWGIPGATPDVVLDDRQVLFLFCERFRDQPVSITPNGHGRHTLRAGEYEVVL